MHSGFWRKEKARAAVNRPGVMRGYFRYSLSVSQPTDSVSASAALVSSTQRQPHSLARYNNFIEL